MTAQPKCYQCGRFCQDSFCPACQRKHFTTGTPHWLIPKESADARDFTIDPPAYLEPESVLRNRERVRKMMATGDFTWPR